MDDKVRSSSMGCECEGSEGKREEEKRSAEGG